MQLVYRARFYIALYSKSLNPTPKIFRRSSVGSALGLKSKGCWFEPTVRHYCCLLMHKTFVSNMKNTM